MGARTSRPAGPRPADRRLARSAATRAAVVEALLALLGEGDLRPPMPRIAARAGVSRRSIFQHFADREALCGFSAWQALRQHQGLSVAAARRAVEAGILALARE